MHSHNRPLRTFAALCHAQAPEIALSSRAECESAQRTRSAPQARSGRPARILQRFCRRMRRSSSTVDVWPPSPSRGAASFFLRRRRCPPSSSLSKRLLRTPNPQKSPGNCQTPNVQKIRFLARLFGGFTFKSRIRNNFWQWQIIIPGVNCHGN